MIHSLKSLATSKIVKKKKFDGAQIAEKKVAGGVTQTKDFIFFSLSLNIDI